MLKSGEKDRIDSSFVLKAQKEIVEEDWEKTRFIYLAGKNQDSALSPLPKELLDLIMKQYSALPDEAKALQNS